MSFSRNLRSGPRMGEVAWHNRYENDCRRVIGKNTRRKPLGTGECACGRRISANRARCRKCADGERETGA